MLQAIINPLINYFVGIFLITRWFMLSFELMTKVKTAQLKQQLDNRKKHQSSTTSLKKVN